MQIPVLVERVKGNGYRARGTEPFALSAKGSTREEALAKLHAKIQARLQKGVELVGLEVGPSPQPLDPPQVVVVFGLATGIVAIAAGAFFIYSHQLSGAGSLSANNSGPKCSSCCDWKKPIHSPAVWGEIAPRHICTSWITPP